MDSARSSTLPQGFAHADYTYLVTVCARRDHDWAEGDEGAIFCTVCTGYRCSTCGATGRVSRGCGTKRCYACDGFGVEMGWDEFPYRLNPWNWAHATQKAAQSAASDDQDGASIPQTRRVESDE
jgi:hypothetical protein